MTPIAPAGLMVWAASPISSRPSRAQSSIKRTMPCSGKNGREVPAAVGEAGEDGVEAPHASGDGRDARAPAPPLAVGQENPGLM